ncbi:DUF974-domain-containing protein [Anaeromyces robustus]|uniref:DUF974-domain-containing protein n=1 Tax=Anaeromyces robustus TaxID=1754192 RepID=A0A1Y1VW35_9FUNG|nr:DUF974-domain-containing protein [Anaeromyces robustus]|eukprot:ORX65501.1 DUF974-domain-containing protein [Anaeromyces robustus]
MATSTSKEQQPISLRVMRLSKPLFSNTDVNYYEPTNSIITKALDQTTTKILSSMESQQLYPMINMTSFLPNSTSESSSLNSSNSSLNQLVSSIDNSYPEPRMRDYTDTEILKLPPNFGMIYLGETFVTYICLNNETNKPVHAVSVKIELQTSSQKLLLVENRPTELEVKKNLEYISQYEIKELGVHILICTVLYMTENREQRTFKRFYKFQVHNPIAVKTKVNSLSDGRIFFEAQIQNTSQNRMYLERVSFEPHDSYHCKDLNYIVQDESPYLNEPTNNVRQYLFMLEQIPGISPLNKLGKLDIQWRTNFGEVGHLQTSTLSRKIPPIEYLHVKVTSIQPEIIHVEQPFQCTIELTNNSPSDMNVQFSLAKHDYNSSILCKGKCMKNVKVESQKSQTFTIQFIPIVSGLHSLGGFKVVDIISGLSKELDHLTDIYIYDEDLILN